MRKRLISVVFLLVVLVVVSCSGQSEGQNNDQTEMYELEFIPKVKESPLDAVDTIGFPEESTGTPITGYQGYPEDDLVKESNDDDMAGFEGGADIDYYNGGKDNSDGY